MNNEYDFNEPLIGQDFSRIERQAFLRKLQSGGNVRNNTVVAKQESVFGVDVSGSDKRSVKAQLAGRGDFRAAWWNLNVALHKAFDKTASMESTMYSFHRRHHWITLAIMGFVAETKEIFSVVHNKGPLSGGVFLFKREFKRSPDHE